MKLKANYFSGLANIFGASPKKSLAAILNKKADADDFASIAALGTSGTTTTAQFETKINAILAQLKAGATL